MAANNSAEVEKIALDAGVKKGGAAKGELVLAMYELANCYRNGWGIKKDPVAAKQYYETAANLGDTDAMNEVAWCYVDGFGTKKDKVSQIFHLSSPSSACCTSAAASPVSIDIAFVANGQLGHGHHAELSETPNLPLSSLICWAAICKEARLTMLLRLTVQGGSVPSACRVKGE
jgi:hypothetical protein